MRKLDPKKIEPLIEGLASEDSFERLDAIERLLDLTQHTFGFRFNDPLDARASAVSRWKSWLKEHQREREKKAKIQTAIKLSGGMLDLGALKQAIKEIPSEQIQGYLNALIMKMKSQESRCDACQVRRATVKVTELRAGTYASRNLCDLCAQERGDVLI